MIVADDTVSKALAYLAEDPHPVALARKDLMDAENRSKVAFAEAMLSAEGPVEIRKATAETDGLYRDAKAVEAGALGELERHRARAKAADMICEIWRSENANARAAERIR